MHPGPQLRPSVSSRRYRSASPLLDGARPEPEPAFSLPSPSPSSFHSEPPTLPQAGRPTPGSAVRTFVNIAELKRKSGPELQEIADGYSIENSNGLRKQ